MEITIITDKSTSPSWYSFPLACVYNDMCQFWHYKTLPFRNRERERKKESIFVAEYKLLKRRFTQQKQTTSLRFLPNTSFSVLAIQQVSTLSDRKIEEKTMKTTGVFATEF